MIASSGIRVLDRSAIAEARRVAVQHAAEAGFDAAGRSNVAIVATELATNLLRHARDGVLAITARLGSADGRLLLVAVDKGPGIADLRKSFEDGYSSAASPGAGPGAGLGAGLGVGLGAVARLSEVLDVYSTPAGTVLVAEIARSDPAPSSGLGLGGLAVAKEGQDVNGDAWDYRLVDGGIAVLVSDGLGHGAFANRASTEALGTFRRTEWHGPKAMIETIDRSLRSTRGAAAAVAFLDVESHLLSYCGVGNIAACIVSGDACRHLVSHNGILGHTNGRIAEFAYDFDGASILVMHSDGISARWQPSDLGPVWDRHPALVAGLLYRGFARDNDDVATVVIKP